MPTSATRFAPDMDMDSTRNVYFTRNGLDYLRLAPDILDLHLSWYILDSGSWSEYHGDNEIEVGYQTNKTCFAMPDMEFGCVGF